MEDKIGPHLTIIPEQRFYTCFGCKYYRHSMMQSGLNPLYETTCMKMNSQGDVLTDDKVLINIIPFKLGRDSETPPECPFLKEVIRNDNIDKIIK